MLEQHKTYADSNTLMKLDSSRLDDLNLIGAEGIVDFALAPLFQPWNVYQLNEMRKTSKTLGNDGTPISPTS